MNKLTVKQAAERIGVSESLVYQWCGSGLLPHYRFGLLGRRGKILIDEGELDSFLAACHHEPQPEAPPLKHIKLGHG